MGAAPGPTSPFANLPPATPKEAPVMKRHRVAFNVCLALLILAGLATAASASWAPAPDAPSTVAPTVVSYQGQLTQSGSPFSGTGFFKFAIVDGRPATMWSNDGTSTVGSEPDSAVQLTVSNGLFNVLLGDTTLHGMTEALPATAFGASERYIRVWFGTSATGTFAHLTPDRRIAAVPYSLRAEEAVNADQLDGQHGTYYQARVSSSCAVGSSIRAIGADGSVTCETDSDTTYAAGNQLSLNSGTFNVIDGSGSGLDADKLDGLEPKQLRSFAVRGWATTGHDLSNSCQDLGLSIVVDAPGAGVVVVQATVKVTLSHTNSVKDELALGIDVCDGSTDSAYWTIPASFPDFSAEYYTFTVTRTYLVTAADTYTYHVKGRMASGAASVDQFVNGSIYATFYPE